MDIPDIPVHGRGRDEMFWVRHSSFLRQRGYQLRPRYRDDWTPSWVLDDNLPTLFPEDRRRSFYSTRVIDAIRLSDGRKVTLKKVETSTNELEIMRYLAQPELQSDPRCHSVPLLDAIPVPSDDNMVFVVIPVLMRFSQLPFRHLGEVAEALEQLFEGVAFLHEHDIIHGDACFYNYMMDVSKMVPGGWHFGAEFLTEDCESFVKWTDRCLTRPNTYYIIDYGLSHKVTTHEGRWFVGLWGQDKSVPEMNGFRPCDGFKVDVYQMGNIINDLIERYTGLEVFKIIADKLTARDPQRRPSACSAVHLLRHLIKTIPASQHSAWIWEKGHKSLNWKTKLRVRWGATSVLFNYR